MISFSSPTNFLTVFQSNNSINGIYAIDPTLDVSHGATPSIGRDGHRLNARIASHNGSIDVAIELNPSGDCSGPARLETSSHNGNVNVVVHDRNQSRFRLLASSRSGNVTLRLPPTFHGPVFTDLKNGTLTFSPAMQARLTTFSMRDPEGRFFLGDYVGSGYENDVTWSGDHLCAEAHNGQVKICFSNE